MSDPPPATPLTDQALARLRKLADGNGLAPDAIALSGADEKIYTLEGTLTLLPSCEVETVHYPGRSRGRGREIMPNVAALRAEVQKRRRQFLDGREWSDAAIRELKAAPGEGWGLEGAKITLPEKSAVFAASDACPACQGRQLLTCGQCSGQGFVICPQCQGRRQEPCPVCNGSGNNPLYPDQRCSGCNGSRFAPCRFCRAAGQLTCPTCHGRRGTPCPACKGAGQITEEAMMSCGAETHFALKSEGLPSGLRRGLSRLGIAGLARGHADIAVIAPEKDETAEGGEDEDAKTKPVTLRYEARLPYADLRMSFGGKKAVVSAFGKRAALLGVPPFLDGALQPARALLKQAASGGAPLDAALKARAIRDALALELGGKGSVGELRRLYSVGLSNDAMKEVLGNLRLALKRVTLRTRGLIAAAYGLLSALFFAGLFFTPLHARLGQRLSWMTGLAFDLALPVIVMALGWLALNAATRFMLRRHFPGHAIPLRQTTGKTGYAMLAVIAFIYVALLILEPVKPVWMLKLMH